MITVDENYNFNDPLKLVTIFRDIVIQESEVEGLNQEQLEDFGMKVMTSTKEREYEEYSNNIWIRWEDIKGLKTYPYQDNWKKYKGDKFLISIEGFMTEHLVFGDIDHIVAYWTLFRNKYGKY